MSGFIQLVCAGTEQSFLNDGDTIDYFHIIYKRYSNFFINTVLENSNNINNRENTVTTFIVQNSGDLLSESYIRLQSQENYIEILNHYELTNNTIKTNILNFYDNYSVKIEDFNKTMINTINVIKLNLNSFLTINSNNLINLKNQQQYVQQIILNPTLTLQTDENKIFYNLNNLYFFYSFTSDEVTPNNLNNTNYINTLLESINYEILNYIRIDLEHVNISFKIISTIENYKKIVNVFFTNQNITDKNRFYITQYTLYLYTNNQNLSTLIFNSFYNDIPENINYIYYSEKYNHNIKIISKENFNILITNDNSYKYYILNFNNNTITNYNFDNFNNNDFNESLIQNETSLTNTFNLNTENKKSSIMLLRLFVYLYNDSSINLEQFINTINSNKINNITSSNYLNKKYLNNNNFFNKIVKILFEKNTLIATTQFYSSIVYQLKTQENYYINLINKKINNYMSIIINIFIIKNIIDNNFIAQNKTNNISEKIINSIYLFNSNKVILNKTILIDALINYNYNNFIFNTNSNNETIYYSDLINSFNNNTFNQITFYYQYYLCFYKLITKSINLINNIYNKPSNYIYQNTGYNTLNVFKYNFSIFPLSSSLYTNKNKNNYFNKEIKNYINEINTIIYESYILNNFKFENIIFNNTISKNTFLDINNELSIELFFLIRNYYIKRTNLQNLLNLTNMELFTNDLNNNNNNNNCCYCCYDIYKKNYNEIILQNIYTKINNELFNGSFININIYKFYFSIGSPLYRLFYLFNFLCIMSEDKNLINIMPFDLITLRNYTLYFLLLYLNISLPFNINNINYDFNFLNFNDNFLCYDEINIFNNIDYDYINIYSPFYFVKTFNDNINNFDSLFINKFKLFITINNNAFVNIKNVILIIDSYFNKKLNNYTDLISQLNLIIQEPQQYENINILNYNPLYFTYNKIYNNNYQSTYSIGILFDNINFLNITIIDGLYNQISTSKINLNDIYTIVNFNIKENTNFIENNNVNEIFKYTLTLFYNLNNSSFLDVNYYYTNLINGYRKYWKNNISYLKNYLIDKIIFINSFNTLIQYCNITKNTLLLIKLSNTNFEIPLFEIIIIFTLEYLEINLPNDINIYLNSTNKYINFNDFLFNKYNSNIYEDLLKTLILNYTSSNKYNNLKFSIIDLNNNNGVVEFYKIFENSVNDIINQYDKFIYSFIKKNSDIVANNNNYENINNQQTINQSYISYINSNYFISIQQLNELYSNLYDNYSLLNYDYYSNKIIDNLFLILNNFSLTPNNYYKTLYYVSSTNNEILNSYTILFFNSQIQNSLNVETELNRFLYYHINKYVFSKITFQNAEYLKNHSLYDIVKMYKTSKTDYIKNLYIIQNIIAYELLNLNLFNDTLTPSQNALFIELIIEYNDFHEQYKLFYVKCIEYKNEMFEPLNINNYENAGEYFLNNKDELNEYINNFILGNNDFSIFNIYKQIIELQNIENNNNNNEKNINCKYTIDTKNIMKKIVIYLFMMFLVYNKLPDFIIKYLNLRVDYYLEYYFPDTYITLKIGDIINKNIIYDLEKFIMTYYKNKLKLDVPIKYNAPYNDEFIIQIINNNLIDNTNYYNYVQEYISTYEINIGYENIYTHELTEKTTNNNNFTISNIIKNINITYNIDQEYNNIQKFNLTNYTINTLNIYYENNIYNINDSNNSQKIQSINYLNMDKYYNKLIIKNINVFLTLINYLLFYYKITIEKQFEKVRNIIDNIISNNNFINEYIITLQGNISKDNMLNDIIGLNINSRSYVILKLSKMVNTYDNYKFSLITPIDYNTDIAFKNVNVVYDNGINIYKKYVNINYNFYEWEQNFISIYDKKNEYYDKILENTKILLNIKNNNISIYINTYIDIFYTWIANKYYLKNEETYVSIFKKCFELYLKYNPLIIYDNESLIIGITKFEEINIIVNQLLNNKITTLSELSKLITSIYYYILFEKKITNIDKNSIESDFVLFFNNLDVQSNYFFNYNNNLYNYIQKLKLLNISDVKILYEESELINKDNIFEFFNIQNNINQNNTEYIYYKFIQTENLNKLLTAFSSSIQNLINYNLNISIEYQLNYVFETFFKNVIFKFSNYVNNSIQYSLYSLSYVDFKYYTYTYINYIVDTFDDNLIKKTTFGITLINYDNIQVNELLEKQILYLNEYYKYASLTKKIKINDNKILYVLYVLKILVNVINTQLLYIENINTILNYGNIYVTNSNIVKYCQKLSTSNPICLDFINTNYIKNNNLNNYFKKIMDDTIQLNVEYNILDNNNNEYENLTINKIFNRLVDNFINIENKITLDLLPNTLTKLINEKNINIVSYNKNENLNYIINELLLSLNNNFDEFINILGGYSNTIGTKYSVPLSILNSYYSNEVININNNYSTIFTLIYNNFKDFDIDKMNVLIIPVFFYFMCMLMYISVYGNQYMIGADKVVKYFISLICDKIKNNDEIFVNKLNTLFSKQYKNEELLLLSKYFFEELLKDTMIINDEIIAKSDTELLLKTETNIFCGNILNSKYMNIELENKYIYNSKINIWCNLMVNVVDSNNSIIMYNLKSISIDNVNLINVPKIYVDYIESKVPLIYKYGIINIMNKIELLIGPQMTDHLTKNSYELAYTLTNINKIKTIQEFYGVDGKNVISYDLPYIKQILERYYYIPLYFFIKDRFNAIPLIACIYSVVQFRFYTNTNTIINDYYKTKILIENRPLYKLAMSYDYILLERDERKRICNSINDNLIERHNNYIVNKSVIEFNRSFNDDVITLMFEFDLSNSVKEMFWLLELFVNDYSLPDTTINNSSTNFILSTLFYIDGIRINGVQPFVNFTTKQQATLNNDDVIQYGEFDIVNRYLNTYKYNTRSDPSIPYYSYSFSLKPESFQPSGTFNMSNIQKFGIQLIINKQKLLKYVQGYANLEKLSINMKLCTFEYNIIRYQSGIAGLLFYQ